MVSFKSMQPRERESRREVCILVGERLLRIRESGVDVKSGIVEVPQGVRI